MGRGGGPPGGGVAGRWAGERRQGAKGGGLGLGGGVRGAGERGAGVGGPRGDPVVGAGWARGYPRRHLCENGNDVFRPAPARISLLLLLVLFCVMCGCCCFVCFVCFFHWSLGTQSHFIPELTNGPARASQGHSGRRPYYRYYAGRRPYYRHYAGPRPLAMRSQSSSEKPSAKSAK